MDWRPSSCTLPPLDDHCTLRLPTGFHIVVIGDSNARWHFEALLSMYRFHLVFKTCRKTKSSGRQNCDESRGFYGVDIDSKCIGCSGCESMVWKCAGNVTLELLGVTHIYDRRLVGDPAGDSSVHPPAEFVSPNSDFNSTQDIVGWYLSQRRPNLIIVNSGLHDSGTRGLFDPTSEVYYGLSMRRYVRSLQASGAAIVWLQTGPVVKDKQPERYHNSSTLDNSLRMNEIARNVAKEMRIAVLECFHIAATHDFVLYGDPVHPTLLNHLYYKTIMRRILMGVFHANQGNLSKL